MADTPPGTQDGQTPEGNTPDPSTTQEPGAAGKVAAAEARKAAAADGGIQEPPTPPAPPAGKTYTQAQMDAAAGAARRPADKRLAEATEELEKFKTEAEQRRQAELTDTQRRDEELAQAKATAEAAEANAAQAATDLLRANLVATHAADLPPAYRAMVAGADEATVTTSIETARAAFTADSAQQHTAWLATLTAMTPEQIVEAYPENPTALAFAERLKGAPVSVGGPSNVGNQPPSPVGGASQGGMTPVQKLLADQAALRGE